MDRPMSAVSFSLMGFMFKVRDLVRPRSEILEEAGIKPGYHVLDFGCGPGSYILPAARLAGSTGKVYALDIQPMAARRIRKLASRRGFTNIETIVSDCRTGLKDCDLDIVFLYDTFHDLTRSDEVLRELHRVLKPGGILSFSDHHMEESEILKQVTANGLFELAEKEKRTYRFFKIN